MATSGLTFMEPIEMGTDSMVEWIERFEAGVSVHPSVLTVNDANVLADRQKKLLILSLGTPALTELKGSILPITVEDASYEDLIKELKELCPKSTSVAKSYELSLMKQETSESLQQFMTRLKQVAAKCEFGSSFDRMVRDKFIQGLRSESIRTSIIDDEKCVTAKQCLEKAMMKEMNKQSSHGMSGSSTSSTNLVRNQQFGNKNKSRHSGGQTPQTHKSYGKQSYGSSSGSMNHNKPGEVCNKCKLGGHKEKDCKTRCRYCKTVGHSTKNCPKISDKKASKQGSNVNAAQGVEDTGQMFSNERQQPLEYSFVNHVVSQNCSNLHLDQHPVNTLRVMKTAVAHSPQAPVNKSTAVAHSPQAPTNKSTAVAHSPQAPTNKSTAVAHSPQASAECVEVLTEVHDTSADEFPNYVSN